MLSGNLKPLQKRIDVIDFKVEMRLPSLARLFIRSQEKPSVSLLNLFAYRKAPHPILFIFKDFLFFFFPP